MIDLIVPSIVNMAKAVFDELPNIISKIEEKGSERSDTE